MTVRYKVKMIRGRGIITPRGNANITNVIKPPFRVISCRITKGQEHFECNQLIFIYLLSLTGALLMGETADGGL